MKLNGMQVPMFWAANEYFNTAVGTELPLPIGAEGEAIGGATFASGDLVVVGNVSEGGATWGEFWRRPAIGDWSAPAPLCQDAERSWVSDACYTSGHTTFGASLLVAGTAFEAGRWLADEQGREFVEIGARMRGMLEEIEKAHIYIATLNDCIAQKDAELSKLAKQNEELAERLARIEAMLSASKSEKKSASDQ
jgi:uncharacterized coiled-coil protein SlyX